MPIRTQSAVDMCNSTISRSLPTRMKGVAGIILFNSASDILLPNVCDLYSLDVDYSTARATLYLTI